MSQAGRDARDLRLASGKSLREIAKKAKITAAYLCDIEHGNRNAPILTLLRIALALHAKIEYAESICTHCIGTGQTKIPVLRGLDAPRTSRLHARLVQLKAEVIGRDQSRR